MQSAVMNMLLHALTLAKGAAAGGDLTAVLKQHWNLGLVQDAAQGLADLQTVFADVAAQVTPPPPAADVLQVVKS